MNERQAKHDEALALNEWVRANYLKEEDVTGNADNLRFFRGAALVVVVFCGVVWGLVRLLS